MNTKFITIFSQNIEGDTDNTNIVYYKNNGFIIKNN